MCYEEVQIEVEGAGRFGDVLLALEEGERTTPDVGEALRDVRSRERELLAATHPDLRAAVGLGSAPATLVAGQRSACWKVSLRRPTSK